MLRISRFAASAAGAVILLAHPVLAQAHAYRHHAAYRHYAAPTYRQHFAFASRGYFARAPQWQEDRQAAALHRSVRTMAPMLISLRGETIGRGRTTPANNFDRTADRRSQFEGMVEQQASANGVPASLVHRVIMRESGYNPRAVSSGNYGMMQIRLGTARAMGYNGSAAGLLDAETNMTYAVRYLAGAYRAAGGNESRAVALYARGYNAPRLEQVN